MNEGAHVRGWTLPKAQDSLGANLRLFPSRTPSPVTPDSPGGTRANVKIRAPETQFAWPKRRCYCIATIFSSVLRVKLKTFAFIKSKFGAINCLFTARIRTIPMAGKVAPPQPGGTGKDRDLGASRMARRVNSA
jgi:hypothetical protein